MKLISSSPLVRRFSGWSRLQQPLIALFLLGSILFSLLLSAPTSTQAAPSKSQLYYLSMPEDDALQMFRDDGDQSATSPVRSVSAITIATTGTVIYFDHWENGYAANITTGADAVWGDGNLANGCPPNISNTPNPCLTAAHDQLQAGQVVILANNVIVDGSSGSYYRDPNKVYFDGGDKLQTTFPVAVNRALWPLNVGSLQAGGVEVYDYALWGDQYISPFGESGVSTGLFEDVRLFIMAGPGGSTIDLDLNDDGDLLDAGELNDYVLAEGQNYVVDGPQARSRLTVVSGSKVQVNLLYADLQDTYELRWSALLPYATWSNDYYSPVSSATGVTGCTIVWVYNPASSAITVNYTFGNGGTGSFNVPAQSTATSPQIPNGYGARFYTANPSQVFLPFSVTDCTGGGQIMDWDTPLFPTGKLTPDLLVGWAPGCTDQSHLGVCRDPDGSPNYANSVSRSVVWVTPLANTTIYVDTNGSGIACPSGAGAEQTIAATALVSYKINNNGTVGRNNVRDEFATAAYNINGPNNTANWNTNWLETGDDNSATAGSMRINGGYLELRDSGTEAGDFIQRGKNLSGSIFARFSFQIQGTSIDPGEDRIAAEVSPNGGTTWYRLEVFDGPINTLQTRVYNISPYISANTRIRFYFIDNLETGDLWQIDNVNIEYSTSGDFDMTGAYIRTCDGTKLAAAYGQDPATSESGDFEALDLGTVIVPYLALIDTSLDKQVSNGTPKVGETITFSLQVSNASGMGTATNVQVVDVIPPGYAYVPGSISGGTSWNDANPYTSGLTWTIASLPPGNTTTLSYQVVVLAGAASYDNYAQIQDADQPDIDSEPGDGSTTQDDDDIETVIPRSAVIGNSVWLDENGDGYRDAGESGLANIVVQLWNATHTVLLAQTVTDVNGNYIFKDVAPGTYQVDVLNSSLPAGLVQTTVIGGLADETNKAAPYLLTVTANGESLQADFGFNWAPPASTFGNTGTGAIGDRLWIDADGDGRQDPGEPGLANIPVDLLAPGPDGLFGTADDVLVASTTSGYDGSYIFDNVAAGAYIVRVNNGLAPTGYVLTGDPDEPGAPCLTCDHQTSTPILLAPGDVFVNADFGYQPLAGYGATIGDTLWVDANRDNQVNANEPRLAGVTVALIRDLNGNGVWEAGEPIIASTFTDAQGNYQFTGVPVTDGVGSDDYLVWVNDTQNVLFGLAPVYDSDGVVSANLSAVSNLTAAGDADQDFAYAPPGHASGEGLIGDTIFYDRDADGAFDDGEGLEGVRVNLYYDTNGDGNFDVGEPLIATTLTNENGQYFFGNLPAGNYVVQVDTSTLPAGVTNTVDQGDSTPNEGGVTLTGGQVVLTMDFGYRDLSNPNSISGTIWEDTNGDGTLAGESGRFAGVTVVLRDANGNIVGVTVTDSNGEYSFNNLPDGTYTVDVTDQYGVLSGYWHSDGPNDNNDLNSQVDPYTVTVSNGQTNNTADFGYYRTPATAGNFVWLDRDGDGVQDADEPGIKDVVVTLTITYPDSTVVTLKTLTGANGFYSFGNLLLDENFNANGGGLIYTISVGTPPSMSASPEALPGDYDQADGDSDGASENLTILQGETDTSYDFGFSGNFDMGDLPENLVNLPDYPTYFINGPSNVVFPDNGGQPGPDTTNGVIAVWLGTTVDTEPQGQPTAFANGDGSDEDGLITNPGSWVINSYANFDLILNSSDPTTVYYGMWLDWNQDGIFDEFYSGSGNTSSPVVVSLSILIQPDIQTNPLFVRVRVYHRPLTFPDYQGTLVNGETEDYRLEKPTAVTLGEFNAEAGIGQITLTWTTYSELNTIGYNLYRSTSPDGPFEKINLALIPSQSLLGQGAPYYYEFIDENARPGVVYYYWLEEVTIGGSLRLQMISASSWYALYLPFMIR